MDNVTIFGSCRQLPIGSHMKITKIIDDLNYPHYTKEILQEIKYLKHKHIPTELANCCFRSGLLGDTITDSRYEYLKQEFENTSVFLVEIASRISYEWNNLYMHHIAEDSTYKFTHRDDIAKRDLTDEEIEEDIIQIRNELYPKPFIIISHFSTYNHGKRFELIQLLERICSNYNIPFINQSDIVRDNENILEDEPVLAHYNEHGKQIVGNILFQKIKEVLNVSSVPIKTLKQVYYTSESRVQKYTFHGFGDYLRGTMYLYQFLKDKNIKLIVNFSNHPLSNVFVCNNHMTIEDSENIQYVFGDENPLDYNCIFTNRFLISEPLEQSGKDFIIKNCLTPRISFENKLRSFQNEIGITDNNYSVIHIRTNDNDVYNENLFQHILYITEHIKNNDPRQKVIIMASSSMYLNKITDPFFIKTNLKRGHVGLNTTTNDECMDTMIEFMLLKSCKTIHQLSVYWWGSGFSDMVCKLFNVNIQKYQISNMFHAPPKKPNNIIQMQYM
jgi:hypothetical protein